MNQNRKNETMDEILNILIGLYSEKGRDFTFRSKNLSKALEVPSQTITPELKTFTKKGIIEIFSKKRKRTVYKTCFEDGDER
jgi:Mn-dependent DtxR family transcriptional regulator